MYRLTPRMLQQLRSDLAKFHGLFGGQRCSGTQLEELIVVAIKSDTQAQHHVRWQEAGHDDQADITVQTNGEAHPMQIKSGQMRDDRLILSGHRLGRFQGVLAQIAGYLNTPCADILAVPYRRVDGDMGRQHIYRICYVDKEIMTGLDANDWTRRGAQWIQTNADGVEFSLRPSMSWQVWWSLPCGLFEITDEFVIG